MFSHSFFKLSLKQVRSIRRPETFKGGFIQLKNCVMKLSDVPRNPILTLFGGLLFCLLLEVEELFRWPCSAGCLPLLITLSRRSRMYLTSVLRSFGTS